VPGHVHSRLLRKTFPANRDVTTAEFTRLYNAQLHDVHCARDIKMSMWWRKRWAEGVARGGGGEEKYPYMQGFGGKTRRKESLG
jgi:hypothetical protein